MHTSVGALLADSARRHPDKIALVFEERRYTYGELDRLSSQLAARLESLGLARGDRISLYGPNSPEWVIAYYAVMKMGSVANPLNLMHTPQEAAHAMNDCGARAVLGAADKILGLAPVLGSTRLEHRIAWGDAVPQGALACGNPLRGP